MKRLGYRSNHKQIREKGLVVVLKTNDDWLVLIDRDCTESDWSVIIDKHMQ